MQDASFEELRQRAREALGDDLNDLPKEERLKVVEERMQGLMGDLLEEFKSDRPPLPEPTVEECPGQKGLFHMGVNLRSHFQGVPLRDMDPCPHCGFGKPEEEG